MHSLPAHFAFGPTFLAATVIPPLIVLVLCVVAGVGTVLLLPGKREKSLRKLGAVILTAAAVIFFALFTRSLAGTSTGDGVTPYFWVFSAIALISAVRVVTHLRPVYSALYFILCTLATAGLFVLLWAEFMAAALVLIYAGAILITYVFVIMLASQASSDAGVTALAEYDTVSREPIVASIAGFGLMAVLLFVISDRGQVLPASVAPSDTSVPGLKDASPIQELGYYLFRNHFVNLQLAGLILTLGMVGAILIARRKVVTPEGVVTDASIKSEVVLGPATPGNDDPHSIPVVGDRRQRQPSDRELSEL